MPLGTALASGLQTYTALRDESRRSTLHDLKVEGHTLRNEGQGLNNQFARDTYDFRVNQEEGRTEYETGRGRVAQSQAHVAESTQGDLIEQERHKTRYEGNRANYWGSQAVSAASDAHVNTATVGDRIGRIQSLAAEAAHKARTAGVNSQQTARDHFQRELTNIAGGRSLPEALEDDAFQSRAIPLLESEYGDLLSEGQTVAGIMPVDGGYTIATRMPDGSIKPITERRSSDADDNPMVISENEASAFFFGDGAADAVQTTRQTETLQGEYAGRAEAAARQGDEAVRTADERMVDDNQLFEQHQELAPEFESLTQDDRRLGGRIQTLGDRRVRGIGSVRANAEIDAEIAELEEEREAVQARLSDLQGTHGQALDMTPERYADTVAAHTRTLANTPGQVVDQQRLAGQEFQSVRRDIGAGLLDTGDAIQNVRETGDPRASGEQVQAQRDDETARIRTTSDRVGTKLKGIEHFEDESIDAGVILGDLEDAIVQSDYLREMLRTDEARLEAGMTIAATSMAQRGRDKGIQTFLLQGQYGGDAEIAYQVQEAPEMADFSDAERFIAGNLAGVLSRQGNSSVDARREARRLVQSEVKDRAAMNRWLERQAGGGPPSMRNLQR